MTVNENIRRIRKERGFTQKRLGELCDPPINEANIRKYEKGTQIPRLVTIEKIASALGVSAFDLMGFEYWDLKNPDLAKEIAASDGLKSYLESLGYIVKENPCGGNSEEGSTDCFYEISGNGLKDVILTSEEYKQLQSSSGDLIFSFLWKKQK